MIIFYAVLIIAAHYMINIILQHLESEDREWYIQGAGYMSLICLFVGIGFCVINLCKYLEVIL